MLGCFVVFTRVMNYLTDGCSHSKFVCLSFVAKCRDSLAQTSGRNAELSRQQLSFCMYYCLVLL